MNIEEQVEYAYGVRFRALRPTQLLDLLDRVADDIGSNSHWDEAYQRTIRLITERLRSFVALTRDTWE